MVSATPSNIGRNIADAGCRLYRSWLAGSAPSFNPLVTYIYKIYPSYTSYTHMINHDMVIFCPNHLPFFWGWFMYIYILIPLYIGRLSIYLPYIYTPCKSTILIPPLISSINLWLLPTKKNGWIMVNPTSQITRSAAPIFFGIPFFHALFFGLRCQTLLSTGSHLKISSFRMGFMKTLL